MNMTVLCRTPNDYPAAIFKDHVMPIRSQSLQETSSSCQPTKIARDRRNSKCKLKTHVVFRTTDQLTESEQEQMRNLFLLVFNKKMTKDTFKRKFFYTPKGYSYHSLVLHEEAVVGVFSAVPGRYNFFGEEQLFSLSVDTMIDSRYRGIRRQYTAYQKS